jgi:nicotinate-nucleotide adenylyltransferase
MSGTGEGIAGGATPARAAPIDWSALRRLGVYGGSFDPVHLGHLHVARSAMDFFELEHVLFVPAAQPPHKLTRRLAPGSDRVAMLQLALLSLERASVCTLELERAGPSYTIDTVRALPGHYGLSSEVELFLLLGSDNLLGLREWREVDALLGLVRPIVILREGDPNDLPRGLEEALSPAALSRLRRGFLALDPVPISSSALRERLQRGEDCSRDLPPLVQEYIRSSGIYSRTP